METSPLIPTNLSSQAESIDEDGQFRRICVKEKASFEKDIFLRIPVIIYTKRITEMVYKIPLLQCSVAEIHILNMHLKGKTVITGRAHFVAENCTFEPIGNDPEPAVDVFAASSAKFKNCKFVNAPMAKAVLMVRDRSSIECENCIFEDMEQAALLVLETSNCSLVNCEFRKVAGKNVVYVFRESKVNMKKCKFIGNVGRAVFGFDHTQIVMVGCLIDDCKGGGVGCATSSLVILNDCYMRNLGANACHVTRNSQFIGYRCFWDNCTGNGLNFEVSTGLVDMCVFRRMGSPAMLFYGPKTNPVISNCVTEEMIWPSVVARDCSSPVVYNSDFSYSEHGCCVISDFAQPILLGCKIRGAPSVCVRVCNGAKPTICGCEIGNCETCVESFNMACPNVIGCMFSDYKKIFHAHSTGDIVSERANFRKAGEKVFIFEIDKANGIAIIDDDEEIPDNDVMIASLISEIIDKLASADNTEQESSAPKKESIDNIEIPKAPLSLRPIRQVMCLPAAPSDDKKSEDPSTDSEQLVCQPRKRALISSKRSLRATIGSGTEEPPSNRRLMRTQNSRMFIPRSGNPTSSDQSQNSSEEPLHSPTASSMMISRVPSKHASLMKPTFATMQAISRMERVQDRPAYRNLKPEDFQEIHTIPIPDNNMDAAVSLVPELAHLRDSLASIKLKDPPRKQQCVNVTALVSSLKPAKFTPDVPRKCRSCDKEACMVCSPCGHHTWCEDCAVKITDEKNQVCPWCDTRFAKLVKLFDAESCSVCLSETPDTVILSCGHRILCYECALALWNDKKQCPVCTQKIHSFRHDFPI